MPSAPMDRWEKAQAAFEVAAAAMDTYRTRLHGPTRSGTSYFEAHDDLLSIGEGPIATVGRGVVDIDVAEIDAVRRLCLELPQYTGPAQPRQHHDWGFAGGRPFDAIDREALAAGHPAGHGGGWGAAEQRSVGRRDRACRTTADVRAVEAAILLGCGGGLPSGPDWREIARDGWCSSPTAWCETCGRLDRGFVLGPDVRPRRG